MTFKEETKIEYCTPTFLSAITKFLLYFSDSVSVANTRRPLVVAVVLSVYQRRRVVNNNSNAMWLFFVVLLPILTINRRKFHLQKNH